MVGKFEWKKGDVELLGRCHLCVHKYKKRIGCAAFPKGVPNNILLGKNNHSKPLKNQGNVIVFKEK